MTATQAIQWGPGPTSRVPGWAYTDDTLYQRELERFFYRGHWCYVGLECEVPGTGDFKRTAVGERSVIMVRDESGDIHVVENRCAHRGVAFCRERHGTVKDFVCPYHQWNYSLKGDLVGLPFRRGVKQDGKVNGGMPADFSLAEHGLTKLKVARRGGAVYASFDHDVEPFEDFLGPEVLAYHDRVFNPERPLKLLGINRQRIPANWKLMQENIKDPYHPGLLHTWFVTFGLWRADQKSQMVMDRHHRHACMVSRRNDGGAGSVTQGVTSFKAGLQLHDERLLDVVPEPWWGGPSVVMMTLFPSLVIQQQVNSLSTRHIQPDGPGEFDFVWTHFGFESDDEAMTRRRLRQANLFGPAGFVSADDGEVIEFVQQAFAANGNARTISELDGRDVKATDHMVTETLIRGMYGYWRGVMELWSMSPLTPTELLALHALYAEYAAALDARELDRWPDFFTEQTSYKVQSRENFDRGLPLALMHFESRGMLQDRAYGALHTLYHDPYSQRHITGLPRLLSREDEALVCEAPVLVIRTKRDAMPETLCVGRYLDRVVPTPDGPRFAQRWLIHDNNLIANSIIDPL